MTATSAKNTRFNLWLGQGKKCYYCERRVFLPKRDKVQHAQTATLDHIIPRSQGGEFAPTRNCVVACFECNGERGTDDARLFLLQKRGMS